MKWLNLLLIGSLFTGSSAGMRTTQAAALKLLFPLERTAYQTNEIIDLTVQRTAEHALAAADFTLALASTDGSQMFFVFPGKAVPAASSGATETLHLHLNGWLLRPGHYAVTVQADGSKASGSIDIFSHLRRSTFRNIDWGSRVQGRDMAVLGEDGMGFNLIYGEYRLKNNAANSQATMRGGADYMHCCAMGGGHQLDLRPECDWSDPYALQGGTARAMQQAFLDRTKPNALGIHFFDEPGLTWEHGTPNDVSAQLRSFKSAFGKDRIAATAVNQADANSEDQWQFWGRWKESFIDAAWKDARFAVDLVKPDFISVTQSQYAWNAYADGYYYNAARSLPVISGHGGYDDGPGSYFYPAYYQDFGRMRQSNKPNWYLPSWGNIKNDELYRLEQYLCFINNLQGLAKSPDPSMDHPFAAATASSIVETNKMGLRLGTIFNAMPPTPADVAVLYSLSQCLDAQMKSGMRDNYLGGGETRGRLLSLFFAGKMIHIPLTPIVEEDVLDGTLAAGYKAIVLTNINFLDPKTKSILEDYAAMGGTVLETDDCQLQIKGARKLGATAVDQNEQIEAQWAAGNRAESTRLRAAGLYFQEAKPLALALKAKLAEIGVKPIVDCANDQVVFSRQAQGDIEYLFAVNATWDDKAGTPLSIKPAIATIGFPPDGRTIYDAVRGGPVPELANAAASSPVGVFRFGAGQMRGFARTVRPIGGIDIQTPVISRDFTGNTAPITFSVNAELIDTANRRISGAAPCQIHVIDPLGSVRYDLYRATDAGQLQIKLPLAANDPSGQWTVNVTELLAGHTGSATFNYKAAPQCGAVAGATPRAVFFGDDADHVYRFCRTHQHVTVVKGRGDDCIAAANRLAEILKPWGVQCTIVDAATVDKPRTLTADEAKTWVGLDFGRATPGEGNKPEKVGFAVDGPVILLGNTADHPLIAAISKMGFLPYAPTAEMPGPGRGYIAWQRDAIGPRQESITLIGDDADGLAEAVGTFYEMVAGIEPMTRWDPPAGSAINPPTLNLQPPRATELWHVAVPDSVLQITPAADGTIFIASLDGSTTTIDLGGKILKQSPIGAAAVASRDIIPQPRGFAVPLYKRAPDRIAKCVATNLTMTAVGYWGGTLQIFANDGTLRSQQLLPQDIGAIAWSNDTLIVGLADGRVVALRVK
jgi:hypothetical protein